MSNVMVKDLWDVLFLEFEGQSTTAIANLEHQINTTQCGEDGNKCNHAEKFVLMHE